jgi:hypothetical protein
MCQPRLVRCPDRMLRRVVVVAQTSGAAASSPTTSRPTSSLDPTAPQRPVPECAKIQEWAAMLAVTKDWAVMLARSEFESRLQLYRHISSVLMHRTESPPHCMHLVSSVWARLPSQVPAPKPRPLGRATRQCPYPGPYYAWARSHTGAYHGRSEWRRRRLYWGCPTTSSSTCGRWAAYSPSCGPAECCSR